MKKHNLIDVISNNRFVEYNDVYAILEEKKVNIVDKDIYIFTDNKRIIVLKPYETFKSAYLTYEDTQNKIKAILEVVNKKYRKNLYYFLCINEQLKDKYIKIINLIEKDQYICKKYVISNHDDFKRISFLKSETIDSEGLNYNDIKVNDLFINLVDKYCKNKYSVIYAKQYIEDNKIKLEDGE
ncbi:ABC-three component system middle component 1 [Clostridium sp. Marseille-Q7071]